MIYILTNSIDRGWRAGLFSVIRIEAGNFVHVLTVTLGVTALMKASEQALLIIKLIGSAYLVFLGIQSLVRRRKDFMTSEVSSGNNWGLISRGIMVAIFNPKTALFFLAFLP